MSLRFCDACVLSSCLDLSNLPKPCDREYCFDASVARHDGQVDVPAEVKVTNLGFERRFGATPDARGEVLEAAPFSSSQRNFMETSMALGGSLAKTDPIAKAKDIQEAKRFREDPIREAAASIDRCEEELVVLTTLKQTAEACLESVLEQTCEDDADVPTLDPELVVRVYEALADDAGPTEGLDVCIQLRHAGKESATSLRPSRSWASDSGTLAGRMGALHVTWNELFRFKSVEEEHGQGPGCLSLAVVREDGELVAAVEVPLTNLHDQRVQHQWCAISCGWRVYVAMQLVRSAPELLRSHISEFEARLRNARKRLAWLKSGNTCDAQAPVVQNGTPTLGGHMLPPSPGARSEAVQASSNKVDLDEDLGVSQQEIAV